MAFFATQSDRQQIKPTVGKCGVTSYPTQSFKARVAAKLQKAVMKVTFLFLMLTQKISRT